MSEKVKRIERHLAQHPTDYVSVIALYKAKSDDIVYEREKSKWEKRKMIAECKRRINEQHSC